MPKKRKTCLFFSGCLVFILFSGVVLSDEARVEKKRGLTEKSQTDNMLKQQPELVFPWIDGKYSMQIIKPNPDIDSKIVKNNFDPNIDYKLRIIDPYTKKEITGNKGPFWDSFQHKLQPEENRYETPGIDPEK